MYRDTDCVGVGSVSFAPVDVPSNVFWIQLCDVLFGYYNLDGPASLKSVLLHEWEQVWKFHPGLIQEYTLRRGVRQLWLFLLLESDNRGHWGHRLLLLLFSGRLALFPLSALFGIIFAWFVFLLAVLALEIAEVGGSIFLCSGFFVGLSFLGFRHWAKFNGCINYKRESTLN